mgnify:CR=1 FL=1
MTNLRLVVRINSVQRVCDIDMPTRNVADMNTELQKYEMDSYTKEAGIFHGIPFLENEGKASISIRFIKSGEQILLITSAILIGANDYEVRMNGELAQSLTGQDSVQLFYQSNTRGSTIQTINQLVIE